MEMGSASSRPLRTDRQLTLPQMTFIVQTARLVLGEGAPLTLYWARVRGQTHSG
jgi:hypothetical protein